MHLVLKKFNCLNINNNCIFVNLDHIILLLDKIVPIKPILYYSLLLYSKITCVLAVKCSSNAYM